MREQRQDELRACGRSPAAILQEARYAVATLQASGAGFGATVLLREGLPEAGGQLAEFRRWLAARNVSCEDVPGRGQDPHMYYFMKSYLWDMQDYDSVAFFDTDFLFLRSPDAAFEACSGELCATPSVASTTEALLAHRLGSLLSAPLSARGAQRRGAKTRNAWNAGFLVVRPDRERGKSVLERWRQCEGAENFCLNQAVPKFQALSPIYNLQHTDLEGRSVRVDALPTVAVHGKVGHMSCAAIERFFGEAKC